MSKREAPGNPPEMRFSPRRRPRVRAARPLRLGRRRVAERPFRDPGRRLARPRRRHARRAARPPRAARRRRRALQPALGSDRGLARRVRLGGQRRSAQRPPRPRDPGRGRDRRLAAVGQRRQGEELRPGRVLVRRLRPRRRLPLPLGEAVADVERAEPGALAPPDDARDLRPSDPQPRLRRDPRRHPGREGRGGRHRAARLERRRLAGEVDPRDAQPPAPGSMSTPTIRIRPAAARRRSRAAATTARRSRWRRSRS